MNRPIILSTLAQILGLLTEDRHPYGSVIATLLEEVRSGSVGDQVLASRTKTLFGTMGSLNDVWLDDPLANPKLDALRDKLWSEVADDDS